MPAAGMVFPDQDMRDGIVSVGSPGVAAKYPVGSKHASTPESMGFQSRNAVRRAARVMAAAPGEKRGNSVFVNVDERNERSGYDFTHPCGAIVARSKFPSMSLHGIKVRKKKPPRGAAFSL
jgi:hypothetical protein